MERLAAKHAERLAMPHIPCYVTALCHPPDDPGGHAARMFWRD